jgi:hypothetical protein
MALFLPDLLGDRRGYFLKEKLKPIGVQKKELGIILLFINGLIMYEYENIDAVSHAKECKNNELKAIFAAKQQNLSTWPVSWTINTAHDEYGETGIRSTLGELHGLFF